MILPKHHRELKLLLQNAENAKARMELEGPATFDRAVDNFHERVSALMVTLKEALKSYA